MIPLVTVYEVAVPADSSLKMSLAPTEEPRDIRYSALGVGPSIAFAENSLLNLYSYQTQGWKLVQVQLYLTHNLEMLLSKSMSSLHLLP